MKSGLKRNVCGLSSYGTLREDVASQVIDQYIPQALQYSCRYWMYHFEKAGDKEREKDIFPFLKEYFIHWLEAMSLLGLASETVGIIGTLRTKSVTDVEFLKFLQDAYRFVLKHAQMINMAPLQVYCSGLAFSPTDSIVRRIFNNKQPSWLPVLPQVHKSWSAELQTLEGHSSWVSSVAFSPDGQRIVSGSDDNTIKLWDAQTGSELQSLQGHSDSVHSVAFSPDGQRIVSGSDHNTIKLWDAQTGSELRSLEGHSDWVHSVAFSPDGQRIVIYGSKIRLWDAQTGSELQSLQSHSDYVTYAFLGNFRVEHKQGSHISVESSWLSNSANFTSADWAKHIRVAQDAQIDAFALNIAARDAINAQSIPLAFEAAQAAGFKIFFSFDYVARGPWNQDDVTELLLRYKVNEAYYRNNGRPLASTFEGSENAEEWINIKASTDCFFIPDWSSLGAKAALEKGYGIVDGLFSWAAWPSGPQDMNTQVDLCYIKLLNESEGLVYMMPVSPWFYTNLPGYGKNWLWRGDDLWHDRWQEVLSVRPEFAEIISWNDYGESHYIGPLHEGGYELFRTGKAPFNYAENMPHDGWRTLLPFIIGTYKRGHAEVKQESLVAWYRTTPGSACGTGGTSANTQSHAQIEFSPLEVVADRIFYSALLTEYATPEVIIGSTTQKGTWRNLPASGRGIYHGSAPFNGAKGDVEVTLWREGNRILTLKGKGISGSCYNGVQNWNAWVGSTQSPS
ncbi:hypothetical protein EMGR_000402 [Emarellia grisea]|nr:hypothetical protein KXX38_007982 [Aspergillus fumigatus]KAH1584888.1 hypothetical protein KXX69_009150 [Aspergillus fumigatus]KAH2187799.1 hypothetical protein KXV88_000413 [Aspergillus fumigatus]OXN25858.1 hypothetical protein CDV57_06349 [Aspergillus fumigatus]